MRRIAVLLLLSVLLFVIRTSAQQPQTLQGIVVDALTNNPIAHASIELRDLGGNASPVTLPGGVDPVTAGYPALTAENGQFVLRNIPPGRYSLVASHNGYVHGEYGQHGPNGKALVLTVPAGQSLNGIRLVMMPNAAISGHAYDSKGAPLAYVQMQARRVTFPDGQFTMTLTSSTVTDDLGAYRLYGLPPGQYVLSAETYTGSVGITPVTASQTPPVPGVVMSASAHGPMLTDADPANQNRRRDSGLIVFYPSAVEPVDAKLMDIRAGEDVKGINVTLDSVRAAVGNTTVTVVRDASTINSLVDLVITSNATQSTRARLVTPGGGGQGNANPAQTAFNVLLPPGSYVAVSTSSSAGNAMSSAAYGYFSVGSTRTNINLVLTQPQRITGRISIEGSAPDSAPDISKMRITFKRSPAFPFVGEQSTAVVKNDGSFSSGGLHDGEYILSVAGFPDSLRNAYVKSMKGTNIEIVGYHARLAAQPSAGAMDVEIVLGVNGGQISGAGVGNNGEPLSNVTVLLVPDAVDRRDLYRSTITDASGRYRFEQLPPGDYRLFSWKDVEPDIWFNSAFMNSLRDLGKAVHVIEGSRSEINVTAIPIR